MLQPPAVQSTQRLRLIGVKSEDDSIRASEKRGGKRQEAFLSGSILTVA